MKLWPTEKDYYDTGYAPDAIPRELVIVMAAISILFWITGVIISTKLVLSQAEWIAKVSKYLDKFGPM